MQSNPFGPGAIKVECGARLENILAQFVPRVAFRENVFGKTFGAIAAVGLLNDLENQFRHILYD